MKVVTTSRLGNRDPLVRLGSLLIVLVTVGAACGSSTTSAGDAGQPIPTTVATTPAKSQPATTVRTSATTNPPTTSTTSVASETTVQPEPPPVPGDPNDIRTVVVPALGGVRMELGADLSIVSNGDLVGIADRTGSGEPAAPWMG